MLVLAAHFFGMNLGRQQPQLERLAPWFEFWAIALPVLFYLLHLATRPSKAEWDEYKKRQAAHDVFWDKIEARAIQRDIQKEFKEEKESRRPISYRLEKPAKFRPVYDENDKRTWRDEDDADELDQSYHS